jgi:hypothetical protein
LPFNPDYKHVTVCRACNARQLTPVHDFGPQPLANRLRESENADEPRYPLALLRCHHCGLLMLSIVVTPAKLYDGYPYASGVSSGWVTHCAELAATFGDKKRIIVDVGGNDGTLAHEAIKRGHDAIVIDPGGVDTHPDVPEDRGPGQPVP